jgi:hypothetical protein
MNLFFFCSLKIFHDVAYRARDRKDLLAGRINRTKKSLEY